MISSQAKKTLSSSPIILSTLNARYIHSSLGLRYLLANMGELSEQTKLVEFNINSRPIDIVEDLLQQQPRIIGFGVYIWNVEQSLQVIKLIKTIAPETIIVIGGPEVSYEYDNQEIVKLADYLITGQADLAFAQTCAQLLSGPKPLQKIIPALPFNLDQLTLPYSCYTDEDIANRIIYVEASRGCPFKCEFCLSALDKTVYPFDIDLFLTEMQTLYKRGARHFKFVDRTFNLKVETSIRIMEFFLEKNDPDLFLHFELIPDHLPEKLKATIARFPEHTLQFEIGIQTLNADVQHLISRKQNNTKSQENISWLRQHSHAHIHADLIIGLPGEDYDSFARGFDQLSAMQPHEIQVGILKRLKGSPIIRHTNHYDMRFSPLPPYNILSNNLIDFETMQQLTRFARYWDMIANSGRFKHSLDLILGSHPFRNFMKLSEWIYQATQQTHRLALERLFKLVYQGLVEVLHVNATETEQALTQDFAASGLKGMPRFASSEDSHDVMRSTQGSKRQKRHLH